MMPYRAYIIALSFILFLVHAQGQSLWDFESCNGTDAMGNFDAVLASSQGCDCGVSGSSVQISGAEDSLVLDSQVISRFNSDFTFSFFIRFDNNNIDQNADVFTIQSGCNRDSTLTLKYFPDTKRLNLEIAFNIGNIRNLSANLSEDLCWHHIAFGISGDRIFLYSDGRVNDTDQLTSNFVFHPDSRFGFSNSDCQGSGVTPLFARLDEIELFDRFLSEAELSELDYFPDRIIARDTTIFQGDSVDLMTGGTCASTFFWEPETSLDDPLSTSPIATPDETTLYNLTVNHGDCVARDSVLIRVIAEDEIDCANLLLPKAFTPNNDAINDGFGISNAFIIEELISFEIFDKSGAKMFATADKTAQWDGSFRGEKVNSAAVLYRVEYMCQSEQFVKFDEVIIIR